jgi:acetyl esterase
MAVAGDSVGALLATISSAMARDRDGPRLVCQLLMYGAFALQPDRACYTGSRDPLLTSDRVANFISVYHAQRDTSFYPPPLGLSDVSGLPPAIIVTAEHDPLLNEGFEYAERLRSAGVPVETSTASGMIHGFLRAMKMSPEANRYMKDLAQRARAHLWPAAGER